MEYFRFTLFNCLTLGILAATIVQVWCRFGGRLKNWPLGYYAALAGFTIAFSGGLNPYWVTAGVACAAAIRFGFYPARTRWLELVALGYVSWRCIGLVLLW
ncbi:MAG: hypothetical protein U0Q18_18005 [Bryobacteraceae bacterium]